MLNIHNHNHLTHLTSPPRLTSSSHPLHLTHLTPSSHPLISPHPPHVTPSPHPSHLTHLISSPHPGPLIISASLSNPPPGNTPLHHCLTLYGNSVTMEIALLLIEAGADCNAQNRVGRTPLFEPCANSNHHFIKVCY